MSILKKAFFLLILFYSGGATALSRSQWGTFTLLGCALFILRYFRIPFSRNLFKVLAVWFVYFFLSTISIGSFHPYFMIVIPVTIISAYVLIKLFSYNLLPTYCKFIYFLCVVSLIFYCWQLLHPDSLYSVMRILDLRGDINLSPDRIQYSILVYTVNHSSDLPLPRNAGFCWEPGPFGCFIVLALFFNLLQTHSFFNKQSYVFWGTLATTQSTTAIFILGILFIWAYGSLFPAKQGTSRIWLLFFYPLIILGLFQLPFLLDKIECEYENIDQINHLLEMTAITGLSATPGRFISFVIAWKDFLAHPLFGYAGNTQLQWVEMQGSHIAVISGLGNVLARYGLFGLFSWLFLLSRSMVAIKRYFHVHNLLIWFVINIGTSISFGLIFSPMYFAFYLLPFFLQPGDNIKSPLAACDPQEYPSFSAVERSGH